MLLGGSISRDDEWPGLIHFVRVGLKERKTKTTDLWGSDDGVLVFCFIDKGHLSSMDLT